MKECEFVKAWKKGGRGLCLLGLGLFVLTGCGKPGAASVVTTDGSTSMEKVVGILGEAFSQQENITVTYNPTGSGAGIQAVSQGRCDLGLSSRWLTEEEAVSGLTQTVLAYDALAVVVNRDNPLGDISLEDLAAVYTGQITNWQQLGGRDAPIVVIGREAGSGTREGFEAATGTQNACVYRQELTATGDVIAAVSQNPGAIGYASLASVKDTVKTLSVEGVTPGEDTVRDGSYGVQRPFLVITRAGQELPAAAQAFLDYALSPQGAAWISQAGAVSPEG
jgi:phosphate transport system substrate-binding protein